VNFFDFMTIWLAYVKWFIGNLDWMVVFGAILIGSAIWIFVRMSRDRRSSFDFAQMFEGDDHKTKMGKFLAFIGGWAGTWVIVAYAAAGKLTDTMFSLYLGILVAGKVASEYVDAKKAINNGNARDEEQPTPAGSVDITVPLSVKTSDVSVAPSDEKRPLGKPNPLGKPKR
jgi:hypothetical protein